MEPQTQPDPPLDDEFSDSAPTTSDERTWALLAHISFLVTYIGLGIGLSWAVPLIIWLVKREESAFVEDQAREALNFQLAVWIVTVLCTVTCLLIPVSLVVVIGATVYCVIGAMEANKGHRYRYPYTFRLISE